MTESLRHMVATLVPDAIPLFETPEVCSEFAELERLAGSARVLLARRAEESCAWRSEGYRSAAEQLADQAGTSVASAQKLLDTSKRLPALPKTEAAVRAGKLSPALANVVSSAAI